MKPISIVFLLIIIACSSKKENTKEIVTQKETIQDSSISTSTPETVGDVKEKKEWILTKADLELIKSESVERTDSLRIPESNEHLSEIPVDFLERNIFNLPIAHGFKDDLGKDHPMFYHFNEFKEYDDFYYFSIIYTDESCCLLNYGITVSKKNLQILNVAFIGLNGGDGGWEENDKGYWSTDSTLELIQASYYDQDDMNDTISFISREIDTVWVKVSLNSSGKFKVTRVDSVHIDTVLYY
ncbi:hypothetical protein [Chondrinema litorale]|uniref:hypothetical protein n=1 Tax=Chondrinema litorale TaxID=2994555 RepID=UPI0025429C19|nr:hypothetical protein [Chondrinema litorale]UZR98115.1 hypothetical protein OQ292_30280 [Chondrinema litorale]